jgi:hypothetical protein
MRPSPSVHHQVLERGADFGAPAEIVGSRPETLRQSAVS